ncbi:TlpA disulfide reductase family protein [Winogradskyella tangerina]|uniref:TlpA disulfide reductase family protein n=1 Tax=Winogradskyella tangerina TaxID=2023240 RepID=UPI000DBE08ED|nr:TlpA disulfide reductase family protein [Winogradskyella tangerina]
MKRILFIVLVSLLSCKNETAKVEKDSAAVVEEDVVNLNAQSEIDLRIYDYDGLEPLINKSDDNVHVVNFWATWCAPCVKELPYFETINEKYADQNVEVLLVSLDFPRNYDSKLKPFMIKHGLKSEVVAFDDVDQNRWIPAINENWTGALPATIIYKGDKRNFYEQSFTLEELETELQQFLTP